MTQRPPRIRPGEPFRFTMAALALAVLFPLQSNRLRPYARRPTNLCGTDSPEVLFSIINCNSTSQRYALNPSIVFGEIARRTYFNGRLLGFIPTSRHRVEFRLGRPATGVRRRNIDGSGQISAIPLPSLGQWCPSSNSPMLCEIMVQLLCS